MSAQGCKCTAMPENGPYTNEHFEFVRNVWTTIGSYRKEDESIASSDIPEFMDKIGWNRPDGVAELYKSFWDHPALGGRAPLALILRAFKALHSPGAFLREVITFCDLNGDGFIQKEEYKLFFAVLKTQYPGWNQTYEEFAKEADTNADGKVSVDEALAWYEKWEAENGTPKAVA